MAISREKFNEVIIASDFDQLIGEVENIWFDCKSQPYQIELDSGKRELAKDISSFLNAQGGVILIGIKTKPSTIHFGDEIEEIRPFIQGLVNTSQYKDVIKSWIYPEADEIEVEWKPMKNDSKKGIVIIRMPAQKDAIKPFLITKTLDEKKRIEMFFGYAERKGDNSQPLSIIDLQKTLRSGFNYENKIKERFDGMEAILKQSTTKELFDLEKKNINDKVNARIEKTIEYDNMNQKKLIILSAYPKEVVSLKTIFSNVEGSIRESLEHPPVLRYAGWSLETLDQAKIIKGEMISVANGSRKIINLYRDATLVFAGLADAAFLSWGGSQNKLKIHSTALVEIVYNFVNFYDLVLRDCQKMPQELCIRVDLRNMHLDGIVNYLAPYHTQSYTQVFHDEDRDAPDNNYTISLDFKTENFNSEKIAFDILKEIYLWFGFSEEKIPYTKKENGLSIIDSSAISKLK